jgi:hypothetical protein
MSKKKKSKKSPWTVSFPWVCSCGYQADISYAELAESGSPVCPDCDDNMKLDTDEDEGDEEVFVNMDDEEETE